MKTRTFEEVWRDIEKLQGTVVETLVKHVKSDIIRVTDKGILRRSEITEQERLVAKSAFRRTWERLQLEGNCPVSASWKHVSGVLALLPEIEYSLKPGTIWLSENKHKFGELVERKAAWLK